jgi:uncharacterized protein
MRRAALILLLLVFAVPGVLAALPRPQGYVSDYVGILDDGSRAEITQAIEAIEKSTAAEIAVIIQDTLGESATIEEAALAYLSEWKVGKKGKDNGLVLLIVTNRSGSHGEYRFETGLGLEGELPDGLLGQIGREDIIPRFRAGEIGGGILAAVYRIGIILGADMSAIQPKKPGPGGSGIGALLFFLIILFFIFGGLGRRGGGSGLLWLMLLGSMGSGRGQGGFGGRGFGGFGGGGFGGFGGGGGGAGGGATGSW